MYLHVQQCVEGDEYIIKQVFGTYTKPVRFFVYIWVLSSVSYKILLEQLLQNMFENAKNVHCVCKS